MSNEVLDTDRDEIETYFSAKFCATVEQALKLKFPKIKNLDVSVGDTGGVSVMFEETEYSQKEVEDFLNELRKAPPQKNI